jgi:hypothetical protein
MASTRIIEEERGTYRGSVHPHNGYWAGDFSTRVPVTSGANRPTAPNWR